MGFNTKNHRCKGGDCMCVGGELRVVRDGKLILEEGAVVEDPTGVLGGGSGGPGGGFTDYYTTNAYVYHDAAFTQKVTRAEVVEAVKSTTIRIWSESNDMFAVVVRVDIANEWADLYTLTPNWDVDCGCSFAAVSTAEWRDPLG